MALEGAASNILTLGVGLPPRPPMPPVGFDAAQAGGNIVLTWMRVGAFDEGTPFPSPAAPSAAEIDAYVVQKATALGGAPWSTAATLPASTTTWSEAWSASAYYRVLARNAIGFSLPSAVRSGGTQSVYFVAPDSATVFELIPSKDAPVVGDGVNPATALRIEVSSRPEDLGGKVLKSVEFKAFQGESVTPTAAQLPGTGILRMRYDQAGTLVVPSGVAAAAAPAAVTPTPQNIGVFKDWNAFTSAAKSVLLMPSVKSRSRVTLL